MKLLAAALSCIVASSGARAAEVLRTVAWQRSSAPAGATFRAPDGETRFARVRIESTSAGGLRVKLAELRDPGITTPFWAVRGEARCAGVEGRAYLEMWSIFPDGGRYFSRTLGEAPPLRYLGGTSGWRPFVLSFQSKPGGLSPSELVVNLVLPAAGTVEVGPLELVQLDSAAGLLAVPGQWFGAEAGLIGGGLGTLVGLLAALVGWLSSRGVARRLVMAAMVAILAVGALATALGLVALAARQPFEVWFSLLLPGAICVLVTAPLLPAVVRRYRELELRRMRALDAR